MKKVELGVEPVDYSSSPYAVVASALCATNTVILISISEPGRKLRRDESDKARRR